MMDIVLLFYSNSHFNFNRKIVALCNSNFKNRDVLWFICQASFNGHEIFYKHAASAVSIYSPIKSLIYQTRLITWEYHRSTCRRHKTFGTSYRPRERNELMFVKFRRRNSRQQYTVPLRENAECVPLKQQMSWKFFLNEITMLI